MKLSVPFVKIGRQTYFDRTVFSALQYSGIPETNSLTLLPVEEFSETLRKTFYGSKSALSIESLRMLFLKREAFSVAFEWLSGILPVLL